MYGSGAVILVAVISSFFDVMNGQNNSILFSWKEIEVYE